MGAADSIELNGKRILVVEDDYLLAADICRDLRNLGATVLGPAPTPFYAMQLINGKNIDAALLDIRLHGTTVYEVADTLRANGVPILFTTAFNQDELPVRFSEMPLLPKPVNRHILLRQVSHIARHPVQPMVPPMPAMRTFPVSASTAPQRFARALARRMRPA